MEIGQLALSNFHNLYSDLTYIESLAQGNQDIIAVTKRIRENLSSTYDLTRFDVFGERHLKTLSAETFCKKFKHYLGHNSIAIDVKNDFTFKTLQGVITQIIFNLTHNSFVHAGAHSKILITVDKPFITISDDGKGVSNKVRPNIFKMGFTTREGDRRLAGCGLYAVKVLCEKFNIGISERNNTILKGANFQLDLTELCTNF